MTVSFKKSKLGVSTELKEGNIAAIIAGGLTRRSLINITAAGVVTAPATIPLVFNGTTFVIAEDPITGGAGAIGQFKAVCWLITDTDSLIVDPRAVLTLSEPFKYNR